MSGYGEARSTPAHGRVSSPISVPWVVLSALIIGAGWLLLAYWLILFQWVYFSGIALLVVGGLMLFSRRSGIDSA